MRIVVTGWSKYSARAGRVSSPPRTWPTCRGPRSGRWAGSPSRRARCSRRPREPRRADAGGHRMRRAGPRPVAVALDAVCDRLAPATLLAEVQRCWPAAAGDAFAAQTQPVGERQGVITVACRSAVWAQELDLLSEHVVGWLNDVLGRPAVRGLRAQAKAPRQ